KIYFPSSFHVHSSSHDELSIFNFLRNLHTVFFFSLFILFFCSGCSSLHPHQQCTSIPFPPHLASACYLVYLFRIIAILTGARYHLELCIFI
uniref:Uncharacterized protein n=1 Tax=Phocoena sinus TaxID=42100 RepID=A0A8C9C5G2_PHOSS